MVNQCWDFDTLDVLGLAEKLIVAAWVAVGRESFALIAVGMTSILQGLFSPSPRCNDVVL